MGVRERIISRVADNMNVNGSVTPQVFDVHPKPGGIFLLEGLGLFLQDPGTTPYNNFGAISSLSNGVLFSVRSTGVDNNMFNLKDNADISTIFSGIAGAGAALLGIGGGWLNTEDAVAFSLRFTQPIMIDSRTNDRLRITVRDNLTGLEVFRIYYAASRMQ